MEPGMDSPRTPAWQQRTRWLAGGLAVTVACAALLSTWSLRSATAELPLGKLFRKKSDEPAPEAPAAASEQTALPETAAPDRPMIVATVNGQNIPRNALGQECLAHFGAEVLETLVNKQLIAEHCRERNIAITSQEVDDEIVRMAQRFGLPKDQLLKMLKEERGISAAQYANEIIWPTIALRKLAAEELTVTKQDLQEAWEMLYGPAVQTRLIACDSREEIEKVRAWAIKDPDEFGNLAKQHSVDVNSASAKGLIQPIRKHQGDPNIERIAFGLQPGEISEVIAVGSQYVILKCESHLAAQKVPMERVQDVLSESIRDKKLRQVSDDVFKNLQRNAQIVNVYNDPVMRKQHPGVAAIVNGREVSILDLAEACIDRHGDEMLFGMINRTLLEQACRKKKIEVTEAEMQAEIDRAAISMGKTTKDDKPDIKAWLAEVKEKQGLSEELYRHDVVWPSVALKKLVGEDVEITKEDLEKSYQANYGERVRVRAIVFNNLRMAQKVWAMARDVASQDPKHYQASLEAFGKLAEQYSIETGSKMMKGEVPPIQRYGGQPMLEEAAFDLKRGEISGVVQVGPERYVVMLCEGRTEPQQVSFDEVKKLIYADLKEKKQRLAMAQQFNALEDASQIDNYLAGTSKSGANSQMNGMVSGNLNRGLLDPRDVSGQAKGPRPQGGAPAARTARPTGGPVRR
jgi:parvulin-like peptidyl-prolyl isomerase